MAEDGLVELDSHLIKVTDSGKLLIRNICMVFDSYTRRQKEARFSKVI
jgi:oxygen-independent coproporphyrinogen-3 oxidase